MKHLLPSSLVLLVLAWRVHVTLAMRQVIQEGSLWFMELRVYGLGRFIGLLVTLP